MRRAGIQQEMEQARLDFHDLLKRASAEDLRRRPAGTRWTNRQLLFHMVFGYIIVRTLMPLVHLSAGSGGAAGSRPPQRAPATVPPDQLPGFCGGGTPLSAAMAGLMDSTIGAIQRRLAAETPTGC